MLRQLRVLGRRPFLLLLGLLCAHQVAAQTWDPLIRPSVDANGVELRTGGIQFSPSELSIGQPGSGGLSYLRSYRAGFADNMRHGFRGVE